MERLLFEIGVLIEAAVVVVLGLLLPFYLFIVHGDREHWGHIPRIRDLLAPCMEEDAQLIAMMHDVVKRSHGYHGTTFIDTYTITFLTAAGERVRMRVSRRVYDSLYYPAHGMLKRKGEWFLSFSPIE